MELRLFTIILEALLYVMLQLSENLLQFRIQSFYGDRLSPVTSSEYFVQRLELAIAVESTDPGHLKSDPE